MAEIIYPGEPGLARSRCRTPSVRAASILNRLFMHNRGNSICSHDQEESMAVRKNSRARRSSAGRKYGKAASQSVERALHREKRGMLRSGKDGKVTSRAQAIAIGLAEARRRGAKVPRRKPA
jgi:hypothetical protein